MSGCDIVRPVTITLSRFAWCLMSCPINYSYDTIVFAVLVLLASNAGSIRALSPTVTDLLLDKCRSCRYTTGKRSASATL